MNETTQEKKMTKTKVDYSKSQNGTDILGFDKKPFKRMIDPYLTYDQNKDMNFMFYTGRYSDGIHRGHSASDCNLQTVNCNLDAKKIVWYTKNGISLTQNLVDYFHNVHNPKNARVNKGQTSIQFCGLKGSWFGFSKANQNCAVCVSYLINVNKFLNPKVNI